MFCTFCGASNPQEAGFCHKCGKAIASTRPASPVSQPNPPAAPERLIDSHIDLESQDENERVPVVPPPSMPTTTSPPKRSRAAAVFAATSVSVLVLVALGIWGWTRLHAGVKTMKGHSSFINSVAFRADGRLVATGSADTTIKLWDPLAGKYLRTLFGYGVASEWVVFSPDGRLLAASGNSQSYPDHVVVLWDVLSGKEVRRLSPQTEWIGPAAFSPDGRVVAAAARGPEGTISMIKLWDVASGNEVSTLAGRSGPVEFSPDGRMLTSSDKRTIHLIDVASGNELRTLSTETPFFSSFQRIAFSPNGQMVAAVNLFDAYIQLWDVASGKELRTFQEGNDVRAVAFSPNSRILASAGADRDIKLWNIASGSLVRTLKGHTEAVNAIAFSPDGRLLVSAGVDQTVRVWTISE
jgi:WD40 repeat protein